MPNFQGAEILQIGQSFKHQNAVDDVIGVVHFTKAFLIHLLAQRIKAPVAEHARVQKILVDRGQLIFKYYIQVFNDFRIAFHHNLHKNN